MIINDQSKCREWRPWAGSRSPGRNTQALSGAGEHAGFLLFVHCPGECANLKAEGQGQPPGGTGYLGTAAPQPHATKRSSRERGTH